MKAPVRFFAPGPRPPATPESLKKMMIPQVILPERVVPISGEERLFFAVFERALEDLAHSDVRERNKARRWFNDNDDEYHFSFLKVCELFDLDPAEVRNALGPKLRMEKEKGDVDKGSDEDS